MRGIPRQMNLKFTYFIGHIKLKFGVLVILISTTYTNHVQMKGSERVCRTKGDVTTLVHLLGFFTLSLHNIAIKFDYLKGKLLKLALVEM